MDILTTQDRGIATETPRPKSKDEPVLEKFEKTISPVKAVKGEKKKSESRKLKKKLNEVVEQKESLTKVISAKNSEIMDLKKSINALNEILNSVPIDELRCNSSIASVKILDLSKKNRQLKAELETTKNRLSKKEQEMRKLEKEMELVQDRLKLNKDFGKNGSQLDETQNKLSALQQKLFESRNKNVELTNQLKLAHKCLQQEIGEHFNLNLLANHANSSNWRGRAQQILHLQQRVKELQERLDSYANANTLPRIEQDIVNDYPNIKLPSSTSFGSIERPSVRRTELQHRAKVDALEKEINNLKSELEEQRSKTLALKVRNKTLNDEVVRLKMKESSLEEQTDFKTINMNTLNDRLVEQKSYYEKRLLEMAKETDKHKKKCKEMELQEEHSGEKIRELQSMLQDKDTVIEEMHSANKKLEDDLKAICGNFLFSCREFRKEEYISILDSLEAEKNSLLVHNQTLNERISEERAKNSTLVDQMAKQKTRICRLEVRVRDLERELEVQTEKKKRSQRITEYTAALSNMSSTCSLNSFTFENSSLLSTARGNTDDVDSAEVIDLKNRLELANEKITILKEKLDYITNEKDNDLKTFQELFANSKNIILETIIDRRDNANINSDDL